jgi:hypothetical protein
VGVLTSYRLLGGLTLVLRQCRQRRHRGDGVIISRVAVVAVVAGVTSRLAVLELGAGVRRGVLGREDVGHGEVVVGVGVLGVVLARRRLVLRYRLAVEPP